MTAASIGPVEYMVVHFTGNRFTGAIAPALADLVDRGLVRIIDLAVVSKDTAGTATILEMQELSPEVAAAFVNLEGSVSGLLSEEDLNAVAEALEPGSTAAAILFEHVWASRFTEAVRAANGTLVLSERIPHAVVAEARASLIAAAEAL